MPARVQSIFAAPPGQYPNDLTWDGSHLWIAVNEGDTIYKLETNGNVIASFPSPGPGPDGLAWAYGMLWHSDFSTERIYAINPSSGAVVSSFTTTSPNGLAFDGRWLWMVDNGPDLFHQIDPATGAEFATLPAPAGNPRGLTFDGEYLWVSVNDLIHRIEIVAPLFADGFETGDTSAW